ncbi:coiled-coil domain-containing protein 153-like [Biomphalaria glabrata]|uniref:Dynein regulatory complex protein 12 n=1 Tax=Biomphalaria glabrata TaxID=6526 RepID=A0A2C9LSQ4_BIOGL|nr:coiled-coil domain-containing protein 153-like [Biomphalaria glabrata]KAI8776611.1 coiled-coil domain-containing protein 153 [Biomphalaria glabrata]
MPPKKKKGKGKKKASKKDDAKLELEDSYKRTLDEIAALKDHLAVRRDLTRRAQSASLDITKRMEETERLLKEHKEDQKDINADMTRQYKTMQTEMGLRIHQLETELGRTRTQLSATEAELKKSYEDRKKMIDEKDNIIKDLKLKIDSMEKAYDNVLREALDNLIIKLDAAKLLWDQHSSLIQSKNKQTLLEFGLNPQDI